MHALHLPPQHLWRATALAALAAVVALLALAAPDLGSGSSAGAGSDNRAVPAPVPTPAWIGDPLAPPIDQLRP